MVSKTGASFTQRVLLAFKKINSEITLDNLEHDFSPRLVDYFVKGVLGYSGSEYRFERSRTDITLFDENNDKAVVIETKRPKESLDAEKWREQAWKYAEVNTRFIGLTNGYRFLLWEITDKDRILRVDINFKDIVDSKRLTEEKLSTNEIGAILFLNNITKEEIWSPLKYGNFDKYYAKIDVSEEEGFDKLISQLQYISNDLLKQFTYSAFDEYYAGYAQYIKDLQDVEEAKQRSDGNRKVAAEIAKVELRTRGKYKKYASFDGYYIWKTLSNRPDDKEEENKQIFCKESIYVLLNRLLFIRICEDKSLLSKKISNGGIGRLREQLSEPVLGDSGVFKQIVQFSYNGATAIYYHFYEKDNPLDWYESGDGELDKVLNRSLWILNQFNFGKVDRDILGKLYERYLPKEERKRLGEFYTPDEVVDYILNTVGYTPERAIEDKNLIDPACGSGGFLVRATKRLIARDVVKLGKATPKEAMDNKKWQQVYEKLTGKECENIINSVATHIHGFDINPFAISISEMNILFQVIDLYSKAVKENKSFRVPRFKVYETDSLETPNGQPKLVQFYGSTGKSLAKDKEEVDTLKKKKYDFVVGNPPYVNTANLTSSTQIDYYRKTYADTVFRNFDLYIPFIQLGITLLTEKGKMSYICSNQFMVKEYGKKLRTFISKNTGIEEIIDFGANRVFDSATNYPLIFVFAKTPSESILCVKVTSSTDTIFQQLEMYKENGKKPVDASIFNLKSDDFDSEPWIIRSKKEQVAAKKLAELPKLSSEATFVSGIRTGKDGAYLGSIEENEQPLITIKTKLRTVKIEPKIIRPTLKGKDVRRWIARPSVYAIYPHSDEAPNTISHEKMAKEFPNAYNYFKEVRPELDRRSWFKKNAMELHNEFYAMMYFDLPSDFDKAEIVTPALTKEPNFALNEQKALFIGGTAGVIGICPKMNKYTLLGILNSKVFAEYLKTQPIKSGGYRQLSVNSVASFYIPNENKSLETKIAEKVMLLIKDKKNGKETKKLEQEVDELVYNLYGIDSN